MKSDSRLMLEGNIEQLGGSIKKTWGSLTDDDVTRAEGSWEKLVGVIKEKTGEAADAIEDKLRGLTKASGDDRR